MEEIDNNEIIEEDTEETISEDNQEVTPEAVQLENPENIYIETESENIEILLDISVKLDWIFVAILAICGLLLIHLFFIGKGDK